MLTRTVVYTGDFKNAWNEDGCALLPATFPMEKKSSFTCGGSAHPGLSNKKRTIPITHDKKGRKNISARHSM